MISKGRLLRLSFSWVVVALGFVVGLFGLSTFGMAYLPTADGSSGWFVPWFDIAGAAAAGLIFTAGSMIAPRNRKHAGLIFLIGMPVAAFCLAYPSAGFLVWRDGDGLFETPLPLTAVGLTILFYIPFLVSWIAVRYMKSRKLSVASIAISVCFAGAIFGISRWTTVLVPRLILWSVPFCLFGFFWIATQKWNWPALILPLQRSLGRRIAAVAFGCLFVLCADVAMTLARSAMFSSLFGGDCGGRGLFAAPVSPGQVVFTARVVHAGRSLRALLRAQGTVNSLTRVPAGVGDWALARVEENFWGAPHGPARFVLLTNSIFWNGQTYLIDGRRGYGLLTRRLPIVEIWSCSRTRPVEYAVSDLRVLRERPKSNSTHLIGYVYQPERFESGLRRPKSPIPYVDAKISVTGPAGTILTRTDAQGIYHIDDLTPADYIAQLQLPETQTTGCFDVETPAKLSLKPGALVEHNFDVFWNGRVRGRVKDQFGKPAHVSVLLETADGSQLSGCVHSFLFTDSSGAYEFNKVPPGEYTMLINNDGPGDEWPFDTQYYPSGKRKRDAAVLNLDKGQEMTGLDITVQRLQQRNIQVSVKGAGASTSQICVRYQNPDQPGGCTDVPIRTDQNGLATVHLYGNSRVRMWAEGTVANNKKMDTIYSKTIVEESNEVPEKLEFVLNPKNK